MKVGCKTIIGTLVQSTLIALIISSKPAIADSSSIKLMCSGETELVIFPRDGSVRTESGKNFKNSMEIDTETSLVNYDASVYLNAQISPDLITAGKEGSNGKNGNGRWLRINRTTGDFSDEIRMFDRSGAGVVTTRTGKCEPAGKPLF